MQKISLITLLVSLLLSCSSPRLAVFHDQLSVDRLASVQVDTPDPRQLAPLLGERLYISWRAEESPLSMIMKVRFHNHTQEEYVIPLTKKSGQYVYELLDADFREKQGILAYHIDLLSQDKVLKKSVHQLWVELIQPEDDVE